MSVQVVMEVAKLASMLNRVTFVLEMVFSTIVPVGIVGEQGVTKNQCVKSMITKKCITLSTVGIVLFVEANGTTIGQSAYLKMMMILKRPYNQSMSK